MQKRGKNRSSSKKKKADNSESHTTTNDNDILEQSLNEHSKFLENIGRELDGFGELTSLVKPNKKTKDVINDEDGEGECEGEGEGVNIETDGEEFQKPKPISRPKVEKKSNAVSQKKSTSKKIFDHSNDEDDEDATLKPTLFEGSNSVKPKKRERAPTSDDTTHRVITTTTNSKRNAHNNTATPAPPVPPPSQPSEREKPVEKKVKFDFDINSIDISQYIQFKGSEFEPTDQSPPMSKK